ncbi:PAS domain-containing sensor histidine kinase [Myxococcus sp. RHSTA-1-4]|uniref:PAS domain-containing sensor histidine kinase n=1 Tax=Myxococcus sp. RHSTA-1-4 TaxID=2874601 RepID=UPI001CBC712A|nr:PAS domain-containing sensor histidine kinase [Myxococcus sp. RHSTA-1-4]MBZ4420380.1 PAS domain-containing protein [Myxococcus sp. RHSTA-1-4]
MSTCATPARALPDLMEACRDDLIRRWEVRVGKMFGESSLTREERLDHMPELVDSLVDIIRGGLVASELERARAVGGRHGRSRYQAGMSLDAVVLEHGLLRDTLLEVLEEAGWGPELAELRVLNQALDASLADSVVQYTREQERALRETESTLLAILDHAPASIYAKDSKGRYLFINRALGQSIGRTRDEVVGRTDAELLPPELAEVCAISDRRVLAGRQPLIADEEVTGADGPHVYQSLKFPLPDTEGRIVAVCGISTDVTEARRLQRERDEAREKLRRVITQLPVILWSADADGTITLLEGEGLRALGLERGALVGRSTYEVYANRPDLIEAARRARAGESLSLELELGGSWFMAYISPVFGPGGKVVSVAGVSLDITERRRAEEVLRQSETRYRLATLATSDVIYDWEIDTGRIEWSELAVSQFRLCSGHPRLDIQWWTGCIHPEDRERVAGDMKAVIERGEERWADEYRFLRGDGTWAVISDRGQVVRDATGRAVRMVGAMQDITEQREAEQEARRRAEFEQLLIGIVGHDLRNPIAAITMATTTLLRREGLDERQRKVMARILSSAERATRMLRDVLDFTQARLGGGIPMQPQPLDLHELTRQVVDEVQLAWPGRRLEVDRGGDGRGQWDPDRLAQVITNLVNNALKYSPEHCPVRVRTRGTRDAVVLAVHNQGAAIPQELRDRLFEPLKRAAPQEMRDGRGLGLGLFIVKHIVDAHGGGLRVRSTELEGTTVLVRLPRQVEVRAPETSAGA